MELGRFFNSKDQPIVLSQTGNHARLKLNNQKMGLKPIKFGQTKSKAHSGGDGQTYPLDFPANDYVNVLLSDSNTSLGPCTPNAPERAYCLQMYNDADEAYMADVYIGTPPQKIRAIFDTGSANTWILNAAVKRING